MKCSPQCSQTKQNHIIYSIRNSFLEKGGCPLLLLLASAVSVKTGKKNAFNPIKKNKAINGTPVVSQVALCADCGFGLSYSKHQCQYKLYYTYFYMCEICSSLCDDQFMQYFV